MVKKKAPSRKAAVISATNPAASERGGLNDAVCIAFYCVGKRLQQFDILTNEIPGANFGVRINSPHMETAARYALTRLSGEMDELLQVTHANQLITIQVTSLLQEVRGAWGARMRREFERPDSTPLESRVCEIIELVSEVARGLGRRQQLARAWFRLGALIVAGDFGPDDPSEWRWCEEDELTNLYARLHVTTEDLIHFGDAPTRGWPVLPGDLSGWEAIERALERHKEVIQLKTHGPWSRARSPSEWATFFRLSWDTLKKQFDNQTPRNEKISTKSYRILLEDLPLDYHD